MHKDYTDGMQEYLLFEMKILHLLTVVCDVPRSSVNKLFSVLAFHSLENWLLGRWNAMLGGTYILAAQWDPFLPHAVILDTWNLSPLAQAHLEHQECSLFLLSFSPSFSLPLPFMGSGMEVAIPLCLFLSRNLFMCRIFLKLMGLLIHFSFWIPCSCLWRAEASLTWLFLPSCFPVFYSESCASEFKKCSLRLLNSLGPTLQFRCWNASPL